MLQPPAHTSYDVVIIGGAMMGSAAAWFLTEEGFDGRILVVEMDPSYSACSTAHTNSCIRQQFSHPLNIRISQFGAAFIESAYERLGEVGTPRVRIQNYGYLYLADNPAFADHLRAAQAVQAAHGAGTELLTPDEIAARYPFYALDDILLGSLNTQGEGYWDYAAIFDGWRKSARARGVEYIQNQVVEMSRSGGRIESVTLASGESITCGQIINATGPRAAETAALAGLHIPVEPRKRFTWIFSAETPLDRPLPLTIDPSGIHVRQDGPTTYLAGGHAEHDPAVDPTDFTMDHTLWQEHVWPILATRIPAFEAIRVTSEWAGHYAYNTLDQNAVIGPHPEVENFLFLNGFSGHGLQQSPAMGRGIAEWITHGGYRSLDLTPFGYARIAAGEPLPELAVI